ncbi:MAG: class B sortase [Clostridia bacterium]|nr:class B sortase [Clostridia bacterium]
MRFLNGFVKFLNGVINVILSAMVVFALVLGGTALFDVYLVYNNASLSEELAELKPGTRDFSVKRLQEINPDIRGWIRIDETNIDYPILQGKDNLIYISKDYKKDYAASGSIFLDYKNDKNFNDDYSVLYGHNMAGDRMFSELKKYIDKDFFNSHTSGLIYTENCVYKMNIYAVAEVDSRDAKVYDMSFYNKNNNKEVIENIKSHSRNTSNIDINYEDKLVALSTCESAGTSNRIVVLATLEEHDELSNVIQIKSNTDSVVSVENNEGTRNKIVLTRRQKVLSIITLIVLIIFIVALIRAIEKNKRKKKNNKRTRIAENKEVKKDDDKKS